MRVRSPWVPRLSADDGTPAERLVRALADDILEGRVETGNRLPAHRDLADRVQVGVGTVTKAYAVLERRGLVRSVKGCGTFVALTEARRGPLIDVSRNTPPAAMTERLLAKTLASLAKRVDAGFFNDYPPVIGHDEHRRLLARWFSGLGVDLDPRLMVLTSGAHHAVSVAMSVACGRTGTLFTESHTYPGALALARHQGVRLVGVEMDEEGLVPEALERALAREDHGRAALYVTPTMQNPTTATMGRSRREAVVAICRDFDLAIIEDDVYTLAPCPDLPALAMLAPERTFYANSLSKTLNPTLRVGALLSPGSMFAETEAALQANAIMVPPLSCAVMEQWLVDGTAEAVSKSIQDEAARRMELARAILGDTMRQPGEQGYHVWMPMSMHQAERLVEISRTLGVLVTSPASHATDQRGTQSGIRVCLGAPPFADLSKALAAISQIRSEQLAPTLSEAFTT